MEEVPKTDVVSENHRTLSEPYSVEINNRYETGIYRKFRSFEDGSRADFRNVVFFFLILDDEGIPKKGDSDIEITYTVPITL
jgi:hypothetical protein